MRATAIYVHYHGAALLERSLALLRRDAVAAGVDLEVIVVDNGSTPEEARVLSTLPARLDVAGRNLGFAGGINRGMRAATGDPVFLINPDARVRPGAVAALIAAHRRGAAIIGPRLRWCAERAVLLPPTDERSRAAELLAVLAARGGWWAARARRRWRRRARRHWEAAAAIRSWDLSGGFLVVSRRAWSEVGEFDEAYRLYFEETDWLARARAAGVEAVYDPAAEAVHDGGASAAAEAMAATWFEESAARFRRRHYGAAFARFLEWFAGRPGMRRVAPLTPWPAAGLSMAPGTVVWMEMSPHDTGLPAAGERVTAGQEPWRPPPALLASSYRTWTIRRCDLVGREADAWTLMT